MCVGGGGSADKEVSDDHSLESPDLVDSEKEVRGGRKHGTRAPSPHARCHRIGISVSRKWTRDQSWEVHNCSIAPDPVTELLGTYFKEITQREKDDLCKHLELHYLYQQTIENNKQMTTETWWGDRGNAPCPGNARARCVPHFDPGAAT